MTEAELIVTEAEFIARAEPLRGELLAHCYRLCGSVQDAEDLVQETMLRGWRSYRRFRGDATVRTWMYRIATNAFLSSRRARRWLPSELGPPVTDLSLDAVLAHETPWLEPLPDALVADDADPAAIAIDRDRLRLALIAALQRLPARQRAALLLREALDMSAAEIADTLDVSVPAVKSLLQRARATLGSGGASGQDAAADPGPGDPPVGTPAAAALLDAYMRAFETSDVRLLERIVHDDALLEATPSLHWYSGRATCLPYLASVLGSPGEWAMTQTTANGQPAVLARRFGEPLGVAVLGLRDGRLARISLFSDPTVMRRFQSTDGDL